jgi:hypothetical protein
MSVREIERRVGDGSINAETYLWREGMDGWKPMPQVPELAPILTRSLRPLAAPPPSMPAPAKAQRRELPARPLVVGGLAIAEAPPSSGSPVASHPIIHEVAPPPPGWAALEGLETPGERGPKSRIAVPAPAPAPAAVKPAQDNPLLGVQEAPIPLIDMPPPDAPRPGSLRPSYESLVMQLRKQRKNPYAIPFAVLAAVVFGVTIGFVLFGEQETKIVKQIIEVPVKVSEAIDMKKTAKSMENAAAAEDAAAEEQNAAKGPAPAAPKAGTSASKVGTQEPAKEVKGLSGLSGLDGLGGPSGGPSGPSVSGGGGEPLSSSQIQSTVSNNLASVKRGCWEKALMTRDKDAPSSARVTVAITVAPSGSVTSATSNGDPKGYTGLSSCIVQRVRGWSFPRSSGQTTVNVPFVFAAQ